MTTVRTGNGVSKRLLGEGFRPDPSCKMKVAGAAREWIHDDGRRVTVGYGLYSRTAQSSLGARAVWGYFATYR